LPAVTEYAVTAIIYADTIDIYVIAETAAAAAASYIEYTVDVDCYADEGDTRSDGVATLHDATPYATVLKIYQYRHYADISYDATLMTYAG